MPEVESAMPVLPGETLDGKYRVERVIGRGAMGIVVAARHLQLDQRVAIKFLRPELASNPVVAERFLREGKAAVKIEGEHVVRVYDVGQLEGGAPFLVMEYVDGMDLAQLIAAEGPLEPERAIEFVLQVCDAMAQAHAAGIIHRDLKPANLFVSQRPNGTQLIKVLDFGISKMSGSEAAMTRTVAVIGSPLYMSPEQLLSSRDVDETTDLWSLGVVLFELLTGAFPFVADSIPQLCVMIREAPPIRPRSIRSEIPEALEAVILRCLEKDRGRRFGTVRELASRLEGILPLARASASGPVVAPATVSTGVARHDVASLVKFVSKPSWLIVAAVALVLIVGIAVASGLHRTTEKRGQAPQAGQSAALDNASALLSDQADAARYDAPSALDKDVEATLSSSRPTSDTEPTGPKRPIRHRGRSPVSTTPAIPDDRK